MFDNMWRPPKRLEDSLARMYDDEKSTKQSGTAADTKQKQYDRGDGKSRGSDRPLDDSPQSGEG